MPEPKQPKQPTSPTSPTDPAPAPALSYEEAREQLVDVVRRLEQGGEGLEESIALWEHGEALARTCQTWLDGARERLDVAMRARDDDEAEPED